MLILIFWGKELHLSNKIFIAVYGFCIKNMRQQKSGMQRIGDGDVKIKID